MYNMKDLRTYIMEDSLDDFDIDGKYEKARSQVSPSVKEKLNKKINKNIENLYKICDEFFKSKDLKIKKSEYHNSDSYCIYKPDLNWGFTYKPTNVLHFNIYIGAYGHINGIEKENTKDFMIELGNEITSKINYMKFNKSYGIEKTSLGSIYNASLKIELDTTVKELK